MNAEQIRTLPLSREDYLSRSAGAARQAQYGEVVFLREIAAQLAEANANQQELLALAKAQFKIVARNEERQQEQFKLAKELNELQKRNVAMMFGDDKDSPVAGTIVKILPAGEGDTEYGQICASCGRPHPIPSEEALRIVAELEKMRTREPIQ